MSEDSDSAYARMMANSRAQEGLALDVLREAVPCLTSLAARVASRRDHAAHELFPTSAQRMHASMGSSYHEICRRDILEELELWESSIESIRKILESGDD